MTFKRLFKSTLSLVLVLAMLVSYLPAMTIPVKAVDSEPGTPFTPIWYVDGSSKSITSTGAALKFTDVLEYYYEGQKDALYASGTNKPNTWSVTDQTDGSQLHKLNDGLTNWTQSFAGFYVKAKAAVSVTFKIDGLRNSSDTSYSVGVYDMSAGKWDVIWGNPNAEKMTDQSYYTASAPATLMTEARTVELEKGDVIFLGFYAKGGLDTGNFQANITLKAEAKEQLATYNISPADGALVDNVWKNNSVAYFPMTITVTKDGISEIVKGKEQVTDNDQLNASFQAAAGSEVSITYNLLTVDPNSKDPEKDSLSEFPVVPGYIRDGAGVVQNPEWTWSSNTYTYTFIVGEDDVGKTHNWTYDIVPQYYPITVKKDLSNATVTIAQNGNLKNANATLTGSSLTFVVDKHNVGSNVTFTASGYEPLAYDVEWYLGGTKVADGASYTAAPNTLIAGSTVEAKFIEKKFSVSAAVDSACTNMGTVSVSSGSVGYGKNVTFTASPSYGYEFVGWFNGNTRVSENATYTTNITANTALTAKFKVSTRTVSAQVHADCAGMGTATVTPGTVNYGGTATFTATAKDGYAFEGWYTADGQYLGYENPYVKVITADTTLYAKFGKRWSYVSFNPGANGTYTVSCAGSSETVEKADTQVWEWVNEDVTLTVTSSAENYEFAGWYINGQQISAQQTFKFKLGDYENQTIYPQWNQKANVIVTFKPGEGGSYTVNGVALTTESAKAYYADIVVKATANAGYRFVAWVDENGIAISNSAEITFSMAAVKDKTITPVFEYIYATITLPGVSGGSYTITPATQGDTTAAVTVNGTDVQFTGIKGNSYIVTVNPDSEHVFVRWVDANGNQLGTAESYTIESFGSDSVVKPVFEEKYVTITLPAIEAGSYTLTNADGSSTVTVSQEAVEFKALKDTAYTLTLDVPYGYALISWQDDYGTELGYTTTFVVSHVNNGVHPVIENKSIVQKLPGVTNGSYTIQEYNSADVLATVKDEIVNFQGRSDVQYTLTAIPDDGYHFVMWVDGNGNLVSSKATLTRYLSESESVSPVFVSDQVTMRFPAVAGATYYVYCGETLVATVSGTDVFVTGDYDADYRIVVGALVDNYKDIGYLIDENGAKIDGSDATDFTFKLDADKVIKPFIGYYGTDITLGAVIGGGSYTFGIKDGEPIYIVKNEEKTYGNLDVNTTYVLTATAAEGYKFVKWQTLDGEFLSDEATLEGSMPANIMAVFAKVDSAAYAVDGVPYYYLDLAVAAAQNTAKKIVEVKASGSIYHSQGATSFEIPAGVTLIVPHKEDYLYPSSTSYACVSYISSYDDNSSTYATVDETPFLLLTLPKNNTLTVNGNMAIGGTLNGAGAIAAGQPRSNVYLEDGSSLIVGGGSSYGILSVCGFIYGNGKVDVKAKGYLFLPFVFNDFRGGGYTVGAAAHMTEEANNFQGLLDNAGDRNAIVPFDRYTIMGVQSEMTVRYQGNVTGYVDMYAGGDHNKCTVTIIGSNIKNSLFALTEESATATITYDPAKTLSSVNNIGRTKITLNGNTALGGLTFLLNVGVSASIDTRKAVLSIPYNFELEVASGTFSVPYAVQLLPGATIRVNKGATMDVTGRLTVYKALVDKTSAGVSVKGSSNYTAVLSGYEGNYSGYNVVGTLKTYPTTAQLKAARFCGAGELIVNGTLNLKSGSSFGGIVQTTTNTGVINVASDAVLSTYTRIGCAGYWAYIVGQAGFAYELVGATKHNMTAQLMDASGNLVNMVAGKTYYGVVANNGTIDSYTYTLCHAANGHTVYTTTETANGLGISVQGAWSNCNHQWTDATCTAPKTCSVCKATEGEALDHSFTNYVSDKNATCTADGTKTAKCDRCDVTDTVADVDSALGHRYTETVTPPTCVEQGYTTYTCSCGDSYVDNYEPATGVHTDAEPVDGKCDVCGAAMCEHTECEIWEENISADTLSYDLVKRCKSCGIEEREQMTVERVVKGPTVLIQDNLAMSFRLDAHYVDRTEYLVIVRTDVNGNHKETRIYNKDEWVILSNGRAEIYYKNITSKHMADKFYVYACNSEGVRISNIQIGGIRVYADQVFAAYPVGDKLVRLCVDLLNYGAASQIFFDKLDPVADAELLANYGLSEELQNCATTIPTLEEIEAMLNQEGDRETTGFRGMTVNLGNAIIPGIQFMKSFTGTDVAKLHVVMTYKLASGVEKQITVHGADGKTEQGYLYSYDGQRWVVEFYGISAADGASLLSCKLYESDDNTLEESEVVAHGGESTISWLSRQIVAGTSQGMDVDVYIKTLIYILSAKEYFAK